MAAKQNAVLYLERPSDFTQSGITKTYEPLQDTRDGVVRYVDRSPGIPLGFRENTVRVREPINLRTVQAAHANIGSIPMYRITVTSQFPVLSAVSGSTGEGYVPPTRVEYMCSAKTEYLMPAVSTEGDRILIEAQHFNFLNDVQIRDAIIKLQAPN